MGIFDFNPDKQIQWIYIPCLLKILQKNNQVKNRKNNNKIPITYTLW